MLQTLTYDQVLARVTPSTIDLLYRDITASDRWCISGTSEVGSTIRASLNATFGGNWWLCTVFDKMKIWEAAKL